ncbi:MAG: hypothetical protein IH933_12355, partial [Euryarchaeota archaeon]|nr:hypothetical protein [Euryarchaeota archaeon]
DAWIARSDVGNRVGVVADLTVGKPAEDAPLIALRCDLDALRMYLRWRDTTLSDLRTEPARYRNPNSLPTEPHPAGDGMITDGGGNVEDDWGAAAFLDDVGSAYGTTPEGLREGLSLLTTRDTVWISPGIPFLVPILCGLLISLTYGDLLMTILSVLGVL